MDGVVVRGEFDELDRITIDVNVDQTLVEVIMETSNGNETVYLNLENVELLIAELQKAHNSLMSLEGYAQWIIESIRTQMGYQAQDSSHDDEVAKYLASGSKMSKSKMQEPENEK